VKEKVITLLQELIRNRCVNTGAPESGNETKSAKSIQNFFKSYGIESEILEPLPGRGSLVARIPGTNPQAPSLMFMGHLDVVPANQEKWSVDPFSGVNQGGFIWGRGAIDMLNMTATSAVAFAENVSRHGPFPGDLVYLAEADEEASGRLGARWLVENHWEKVKADNVITEGGGYFINTGERNNISIAVGEKGLAFTKLVTKGISGHGSLPYMADNAALKIVAAIHKINQHKQKQILKRPYKDMVKSLAISRWLKVGLLTPGLIAVALKALYKKNRGIAKQLHAASRMTISPNIINTGTKINIIPDYGAIELDIRILPDQTVEDVVNEISCALGNLKNQFQIEIVDFFPSNISTLDAPLFTATREIIGTFYPGKAMIPILFSGVTDGRFWRMRGSTVYGFSLYDEDFTLTEFTKMIHGVDERVSLKSLELTYNYFYKLPETFFRLLAEA